MSVGKQISETIDKMQAGDPEGALFQLCATIEVTANKEFGRQGGSCYKDFIHQNLALITSVAFEGLKGHNLHIAYDHPKLKRNPDGVVPVQDILYHVVRCGLYHEAALPDSLKFTNEGEIRTDENGVLILPSALIYGLIIAVVVSPSNQDERAPKESMLKLGGFGIPVNKLWGRRGELLWLMDAVAEARRLLNAASAT